MVVGLGALGIGVVGGGNISDSFIPFFQANPGVREVRLAELIGHPEVGEGSPSAPRGDLRVLRQECASDVDAIAIFTRRWTHGPLVVRALRAGKHVYSSVPIGITVEEMSDILDAVGSTGLTYMLGETSF